MECNERRGVLMRKKICQLCMLVISLTLVIGLVINVSNQNSVEAKDSSSKGPEVTDYFTVINEDGSTSIVDFDDIDKLLCFRTIAVMVA